jgi:hypothetical protein
MSAADAMEIQEASEGGVGTVSAARERYLSTATDPRTPSGGYQRTGSSSAIDPAELPAPGTASQGGSLWQQNADLRAALEQANKDADTARRRASEKEALARELRDFEARAKEQAQELDVLRARVATLEAEAAGAYQ